MSYSLKQLHKLTDDEIIKQYDEQAIHTCVGINYYADELNRRSTERSNRTMVRCTIAITIMTAVMIFATIANVIIAVIN
jgi:hypothetical protein